MRVLEQGDNGNSPLPDFPFHSKSDRVSLLKKKMNTYFMIRRNSDNMVIKIYSFPREFPEGMNRRQVFHQAREELEREYPETDYTLLLGTAISPDVFLRVYPELARGALNYEVEELDGQFINR